MKILLIGDYSMVHKNLKDGLEQLGHTVVLTSDGDGWKKLPGSDLPMTPKSRCNLEFRTRLFRIVYHRVIRFFESFLIIRYYQKLCRENEFDVIHAMSADLFDFGNRKRIYRCLLRLSHNQLFVSIPGDDCYIYEAWKRGVFRYTCFDDNPAKIRHFSGTTLRSVLENRGYRYTIERAKALIPLNPYETEIPFEGLKNLRKVIPLPLNVSSVPYSENVVKDKIIIYHGVGYVENKGSNYILEALDRIKEQYGDRVEIVTTNQIPYENFLEKLRNCHIYMDQCKSYAYGMSAVIAMAMGKAVMSGNEPEILPSFEGHDCPVINIIPNTDQIVCELEKLISSTKQLLDLGKRGRKFVEELHDCKTVAKRYLDEWGVTPEK